MKYLLIVASFLFLNYHVVAQDENIQWFENLEDVQAYASTNKTNILMVFAGSDWCKPCIKFKKDILEAADFQTWGQSKLAILYLDFPARKKNKLPPEQTEHNETLAEQYNKSGVFPNIFLLDAKAQVLANPSFKGQSVSDFTASLENSLILNLK